MFLLKNWCINFPLIAFIEKNCWAGLEEYFSSLIKAISVECEENNTGSGGGPNGLKRKARRRRRTTNAGVSLQTHAPDLLSKHVSNTVVLPHNQGITHAFNVISYEVHNSDLAKIFY